MSSSIAAGVVLGLAISRLKSFGSWSGLRFQLRARHVWMNVAQCIYHMRLLRNRPWMFGAFVIGIFEPYNLNFESGAPRKLMVLSMLCPCR